MLGSSNCVRKHDVNGVPMLLQMGVSRPVYQFQFPTVASAKLDDRATLTSRLIQHPVSASMAAPTFSVNLPQMAKTVGHSTRASSGEFVRDLNPARREIAAGVNRVGRADPEPSALSQPRESPVYLFCGVNQNGLLHTASPSSHLPAMQQVAQCSVDLQCQASTFLQDSRSHDRDDNDDNITIRESRPKGRRGRGRGRGRDRKSSRMQQTDLTASPCAQGDVGNSDQYSANASRQLAPSIQHQLNDSEDLENDGQESSTSKTKTRRASGGTEDPSSKSSYIKRNVSRYKTELCRSFQESNACSYGHKCQFAHGWPELRPISRHPKYKTQLCKTYHKDGFCSYGPRCLFVHDTANGSSLSSADVVALPQADADHSADNSHEIPCNQTAPSNLSQALTCVVSIDQGVSSSGGSSVNSYTNQLTSPTSNSNWDHSAPVSTSTSLYVSQSGALTKSFSQSLSSDDDSGFGYALSLKQLCARIRSISGDQQPATTVCSSLIYSDNTDGEVDNDAYGDSASVEYAVNRLSLDDNNYAVDENNNVLQLDSAYDRSLLNTCSHAVHEWQSQEHSDTESGDKRLPIFASLVGMSA